MALDVARAERDLTASVEHLMKLTGKKVGVVGFYPGTKHAFFNDERPVHDPAAAELSWTRTIAFFDRNL